MIMKKFSAKEYFTRPTSGAILESFGFLTLQSTTIVSLLLFRFLSSARYFDVNHCCVWLQLYLMFNNSRSHFITEMLRYRLFLCLFLSSLSLWLTFALLVRCFGQNEELIKENIVQQGYHYL